MMDFPKSPQIVVFKVCTPENWKITFFLSEDTSSGCFSSVMLVSRGVPFQSEMCFFFQVFGASKKVVKFLIIPETPRFFFSTLFQTIPQTPSRRRWRLSQNSDETETHGKCGPAENGQFIDILWVIFLKAYMILVVWGISIME